MSLVKLLPWISAILLMVGCSNKPELISILDTNNVVRYRYIKVTGEDGKDQVQGSFQAFKKDGTPWFHLQINRPSVHGDFSLYAEGDRLRLRIAYQNGIRNGEFLENRDDETPWKTGFYANGKRVGIFDTYYSGQRLESRLRYLDGEPDGLQSEFYETGQVRRKELIENGQQSWVQIFLKTGILKEWKQMVDGAPFDYQMKPEVKIYLNGATRHAFATIGNGKYKGQKMGVEKKWHPGGILAVLTQWNKGVIQEHQEWETNAQLIRHEKYSGDQGEGKSWYPNGDLKVEEFFLMGKIHGQKTTFYRNGQRATREHYRNGLKEGLFEEWTESGEMKYSSEYSSDKKNGKTTIYDPPGVRSQERNYKDDLMHGPSTMWYGSGQVEQISSFRMGVEEGVWISYFPDGLKKAQVNYRLGKKDGLLKEFYSSGKVRKEIEYKLDLMDGEQKQFEENGNLLKKSQWKAGKRHGLEIHYTDGKTVLESFLYFEDQKNGPSRIYNLNGKLRKELTYRKDVLFGPVQDFYPNGRLMRECLYREGIKTATCLFWTEEGLEVFDEQTKKEIDAKLGD